MSIQLSALSNVTLTLNEEKGRVSEILRFAQNDMIESESLWLAAESLMILKAC